MVCFFHVQHLTKQEIISSLRGARSSDRYIHKNKFSGGGIILKVKGKQNLIHLNVDRLKMQEQ
jgi:hypothetical protein